MKKVQIDENRAAKQELTTSIVILAGDLLTCGKEPQNVLVVLFPALNPAIRKARTKNATNCRDLDRPELEDLCHSLSRILKTETGASLRSILNELKRVLVSQGMEVSIFAEKTGR